MRGRRYFPETTERPENQNKEQEVERTPAGFYSKANMSYDLSIQYTLNIY